MGAIYVLIYTFDIISVSLKLCQEKKNNKRWSSHNIQNPKTIGFKKIIEAFSHLISTPPPKASKLLLLKTPFKFWNYIHQMLHVKLSFMKYIVFNIFTTWLVVQLYFSCSQARMSNPMMCQISSAENNDFLAKSIISIIGTHYMLSSNTLNIH